MMLSTSFLKVFFVGLLGGAADAIPGISGGTVYYVLGVYEELLGSLKRCWTSLCTAFSERSFIPLRKEGAWKYLGVLGSGVFLSFLILARVILHALEHPSLRPALLSIFFGLVVGSALVCLRSIVTWKLSRVISLAVGLLLGFFLMSCPELVHEPKYTVPIKTIDLPNAQNVSEDGASLTFVPHSAVVILKSQGLIADEDSVTDEDLGVSLPVKNVAKGDVSFFRPDLVAAGVLAISAMLLPGISGSYILNVLGVYGSILSALLDIVGGLAGGEIHSLAYFIVINVTAGIVIGALLFSQTILWLFSRFHDGTHAFLSGCMIGSMWSVWPYQHLGFEINPFRIKSGLHAVSNGNYLPSLQEVCGAWYLPCLMLLAVITVCALNRLASRRRV